MKPSSASAHCISLPESELAAQGLCHLLLWASFPYFSLAWASSSVIWSSRCQLQSSSLAPTSTLSALRRCCCCSLLTADHLCFSTSAWLLSVTPTSPQASKGLPLLLNWLSPAQSLLEQLSEAFQPQFLPGLQLCCTTDAEVNHECELSLKNTDSVLL